MTVSVQLGSGNPAWEFVKITLLRNIKMHYFLHQQHFVRLIDFKMLGSSMLHILIIVQINLFERTMNLIINFKGIA